MASGRASLFTFVNRTMMGHPMHLHGMWMQLDTNKLWLKTKGGKSAGGKLDDAEVQLLYSRLWTDFFDVQAVVRYDPEPHPRRGYAMLGIQGLAPCLARGRSLLVLARCFILIDGCVANRLLGAGQPIFVQRKIFF
jgi:copper resistance protein B